MRWPQESKVAAAGWMLALGLLLLNWSARSFGVHAGAGALTQRRGESNAAANTAAPLPRILYLGLEAYRAEGPQSAMRAWVKNGPLDGTDLAANQANALEGAQAPYGVYRSYDVIRSQDLTPASRMYFISIDYDRGPLFLRFLVYRVNTSVDWIVTGVDFDARPERVLPEASYPSAPASAAGNPPAGQ